MSNYRRPRAPGATIFFTVALAGRGADLLVREIGLLREAVRATRAERRFWGEARPEIGPVDRFQRRTGEAPAAKPITSATRRTMRRMSAIAGSTR